MTPNPTNMEETTWENSKLRLAELLAQADIAVKSVELENKFWLLLEYVAKDAEERGERKGRADAGNEIVMIAEVMRIQGYGGFAKRLIQIAKGIQLDTSHKGEETVDLTKNPEQAEKDFKALDDAFLGKGEE